MTVSLAVFVVMLFIIDKIIVKL